MVFQVIAKNYLYINGKVIDTFTRIPFVSVLPMNVVLYLKDLKLSLPSISALKLATSSLE